MGKVNINQLMKDSKVRDYSYAVIFLLVSSFFAIAVIKPVLSVAVSLDREEKDLIELNQIYQKNIDKVIEIQNDLDAIAQQRQLLEQALPENPNVSTIIGEIGLAATSAGLKINNFQVDKLEIDQTSIIKSQPQPIKLNIALNGNHQQLNTFINLLTNQRRLKVITNFKVETDRFAKDDQTQEFKLNFQINISGYYIQP